MSLLALGILSVRMEFIDIKSDKKVEKTFKQLFPQDSELILLFYFLKPFLMAILCKYRGMTNQSYYS